MKFFYYVGWQCTVQTFMNWKFLAIWYTVVYCSKPGLKRSASHLVSSVDVGPCLEEYLHHTGVAFAGCYCQRSVSTLWGKVERDTNMMQSYGFPATLQSISWLLIISSWYVMFMASWHLSLLQCLTTGGLQTKIITGIPVHVLCSTYTHSMFTLVVIGIHTQNFD